MKYAKTILFIIAFQLAGYYLELYNDCDGKFCTAQTQPK